MTSRDKQGIRLNRFIAMCGICSRRKADLLIQQGLIKINNEVITNLGQRVFLNDQVFFQGSKISPEQHKYLLLNKPKGYITTTKDEQGRLTVMHLIKGAVKEQLLPVGRLDKDTTGLLLFTNDGLLAKKLTHPKHKISKTYHVILDKALNKTTLLKIKKGVSLEDGFLQVDEIHYINNNKKRIQLKIHVGKNRIVRRLFSFLGYQVLELDRPEYAFLNNHNLPLGEWRLLSLSELKILKQDS